MNPYLGSSSSFRSLGLETAAELLCNRFLHKRGTAMAESCAPGQCSQAGVFRYRMPDIIAKKRDGGELSQGEIDWFIKNILGGGGVDDSQIGSMLMAMFLKGLSHGETLALTKAMRDSGDVLSWPSDWRGIMADKHSTGGIGDKISLALAPALAACGLKVPMISGRGLGITGGTLDKLESIPGYTVMVSTEKMTSILKDVGCCIVGQTENLIPADRKLYAIRDVTSTVGSVPLIVASIVSKKAAESVDALVLDVKFGRGAFMKTMEEGRQLAQELFEVSSNLGTKTTVFLTEMNHPIGLTMGNALEVAEIVQCLQGGGPDDLNELVQHLGGYLMHSCGRTDTPRDGITAIQRSLKDGSACKKFQQMLSAQGVDHRLAERLCTTPMHSVDDVWSILQRSPYTTELLAEESGYVNDIDALKLGKVTLELGAGRTVAGHSVDHAVGLRLLVRVGSKLEKGQVWLCVYHNTSPLPDDHKARLQSGLAIGAESVCPLKRICEIVPPDPIVQN